MSDDQIKHTPGVLLNGADGAKYFVPHSDLSKYRLADEAARTVPVGLAGQDADEQISPHVRRVTAFDVPLLHHGATDGAGFPAPEGAAAFPMPENAAEFPAPESAAGFPAPEAAASFAGFPTPELHAEDATSFPMPENEGVSFPTPEADDRND